MRIRSYFSIFLAVCLLGSYLSVYVLVEQKSIEQGAARRLADSKLAIKDVERLTSHLRQLIITTDLILASGVTYLVAGAIENAGLIADDVKVMQENALYQDSVKELDILQVNLQQIRQTVHKAGTLDPERDSAELSELLNQSDKATIEIMTAVDRLEERYSKMVALTLAYADTQHSRGHWLTLAVICMVSLLIAVIWLWTARNVSRPVRLLSDRAEYALEHAGVFHGVQGGPVEVRQLSRKLNRLIGRLEEEVANRTAELTLSKSELEKTNSRLEEEIRQHYLSHARFESAFNNAAIGMAIVDLNGRVAKFNENFRHFFGHPAAELTNTPYTRLLYKKERDTFKENFARLIEQQLPQIQLQQQYYDASGSGRWGLLSASLVTDEYGAPSYAIFQLQDITDAYQLSQKLTYQAQHDALTGLCNRYEFEKRLKELIDDAKTSQGGVTHVLCYLDLDQFKVINDTCGHLAGDELLKNVGGCLASRVREADVVARLGGDEFGLLLRNCPREKAVEIANTLREEISNLRYQYEDKVFRVGASMGIAIVEGGGLNVKDLLSAADTACYVAKEAGRNRIHVFDLEDDVLAMRTREMMVVSNINHALEDDRFTLVRQPIVALNDQLGDATGNHYEVLLRMQNEEGHTISPGLFLPAAERYHLASRIDRWVIETTLRYLDQHPSDAAQLEKYAINLSGQTLTDKELLKDIAVMVKKARLTNIEICFEITETAAISNLQNARDSIEDLKALGCTFALDDFGRGLSSFGYLKSLPVDYLKIDGEFIRDILIDEVDLAMVKSINEVAHASGKLTVAEFVENAEIADKLRAIGVDYAQGYHFGKPATWIPCKTGRPMKSMAN